MSDGVAIAIITSVATLALGIVNAAMGSGRNRKLIEIHSLVNSDYHRMAGDLAIATEKIASLETLVQEMNTTKREAKELLDKGSV